MTLVRDGKADFFQGGLLRWDLIVGETPLQQRQAEFICKEQAGWKISKREHLGQ